MRPAPATLRVHVPMRFAIRSGRKAIVSDILPDGLPSQRTEDALLKAIAKAFRWRKQIESGEFATVTELARAHELNESYARRLLRLTPLSPEIVMAILDRRQSPDLTLEQLTKPLPLEWDLQASSLERLQDL